MIIIEAIIDENGTAKPKEIPINYYGIHFNGDVFIFFENENEQINYLENL